MDRPFRLTCYVLIGCYFCQSLPPASAQQHTVSSFQTQQLSDVYFSEGARPVTINGDGNADVVCGPYWFAGPDFKTRHEIYPPLPQDRERYADNFFSWVYDFDGDGSAMSLSLVSRGHRRMSIENPASDVETHWEKHQVIDWVSNESPHFTNLVGDAKPELVCTRDGFFGFATLNDKDPFGQWTFHPISEQIASPKIRSRPGYG